MLALMRSVAAYEPVEQKGTDPGFCNSKINMQAL